MEITEYWNNSMVRNTGNFSNGSLFNSALPNAFKVFFSIDTGGLRSGNDAQHQKNGAYTNTACTSNQGSQQKSHTWVSSRPITRSTNRIVNFNLNFGQVAKTTTAKESAELLVSGGRLRFLAHFEPDWICSSQGLSDLWARMELRDIYLSSMFLSITIYLSNLNYLSIYLSIDLSIYRSIDLSIYRSIDLSIYRSIYLSIYRSIDLSIYLSIIYLSI